MEGNKQWFVAENETQVRKETTRTWGGEDKRFFECQLQSCTALKWKRSTKNTIRKVSSKAGTRNTQFGKGAISAVDASKHPSEFRTKRGRNEIKIEGIS